MKGKADLSQPPPNYSKSSHATNSFSHRASPAQVCSYFIITAEIIIYYLCIHKLNPNWILFGVYTFTTAIMVFSAVVSSCSNPTDPVVYLYKWSKYDKSIAFETNYEDSFYCEFCESFCTMGSKHCRICNRCVTNFDHHCVWINNCIGSSNYSIFFLLILSTFIHIIAFEVAAAIVTVGYSKKSQQISWYIPIWVMMVILGLLGFLLLQLVILHVYLQCRGITTYQFLQERRKMEEYEQQQKMKRKQERKVENISPKVVESEQSHSNINVIIEKRKSNLIKIGKNQTSNLCQEPSIISESENQRGKMGQIEEESEQKMPNFLKNNKSLKIIFGSDKVEVPSRSKTRINKIV